MVERTCNIYEVLAYGLARTRLHKLHQLEIVVQRQCWLHAVYCTVNSEKASLVSVSSAEAKIDA